MERPDEPKLKLPGLRIFKTALAAFLCGVLGYVRGQLPYFSIITAMICLQQDTQKSIKVSLNRMAGSAVGGIFGFIIVFFSDKWPIEPLTPLYYLIVSAMLIPTIYFTLLIKMPEISLFSGIMFMSIAIANINGDLWLFSVHRFTDTLIGILIALLVNIVIPKRKSPAEALTESGTDMGRADREADRLPQEEETEEAED